MINVFKLSILSLGGLLCFSAGSAKADLVNLSANLPVGSYSASSIYGADTPAVGFNGGYWLASGYSGWIKVDLGGLYDISQVVLTPGIGYGQVYSNGTYQYTTETRVEEILVGTDLSHMSVVYDKDIYSQSQVAQTLSFAATLGEFVEILVPSSQSWVGFSNIQVEGTSVPEPSSFALVFIGVVGLGALVRAKRFGRFPFAIMGER